MNKPNACVQLESKVYQMTFVISFLNIFFIKRNYFKQNLMPFDVFETLTRIMVLEPGRQKSGRQNCWQQIKHAAIVFQREREHVSAFVFGLSVSTSPTLKK